MTAAPTTVSAPADTIAATMGEMWIRAAKITATVSATLTPGTYELVCLMPGHYAAGQHATFTVN